MSNDDLTQLSNLADPLRRSLYEFVVSQHRPVTREEAAGATGAARGLAAYHLDKLAEAGLLDFSYARPEGRGGPGAGRPAKRYVRAAHEISVSVPARSYLLMAEVLAKAVDSDPSGQMRRSAGEAARASGRETGTGTDVPTTLRDCGYEPHDLPDGTIEMRNCPFHQLVSSHTGLVCDLNLDLVSGILEGHDDDPRRARLDPSAHRCCVVIDPSPKDR